MKKFRFLAFAAAGMLLAACSTNDTIADGGQDATKEGTGYLSVTINLPTTPATRAANDKYDDGLASEYAVKDAQLLLFHGESEAAATFFQAVNLILPDRVDEIPNDNITSSYLSYAEVNDSYTKDLYALVLVNSKNVFNLGGETPTFTTKDGTYALVAGTTTISDLQDAVSNASFYTFADKDNGYFFMTNAVLSNTSGGTSPTQQVGEDGKVTGTIIPSKSNLSVLAKLKDDCIKDSRKEAQQNPAGSVFVERAVAKATLRVASGAGDALGIKSVQWALNNTEPTSFIVRNMFSSAEDADYIGYSSEKFAVAPNYRFVGHTQIGKTPVQPTVNFYRTYWCVDPQYDKRATLDNRRNYVNAGLENPQYCYENTFNVKNQTYNNTTRAIIKVETDGKDFYTVNGSDTKIDEAAAKTYIQKTFIEDAALVKLFTDNLKADKYEIVADCFDWTNAFVFNEKTGVYSIDGSKVKLSDKVLNDKTNFKEGAFSNETDKTNAFTTAASTANTYTEVLKFSNGVMYYEARFQHFAGAKDTDADLAPWNTWESETTKPQVGDVNKAYRGNAEKNYLGRYGMVRNNWYDVEITKFEHIGSPVDPSKPIKPDPTPDDPDPKPKDPDIPDTPDDNLNSKYISVKVNVLSWAKRVQGWSF